MLFPFHYFIYFYFVFFFLPLDKVLSISRPTIIMWLPVFFDYDFFPSAYSKDNVESGKQFLTPNSAIQMTYGWSRRRKNLSSREELQAGKHCYGSRPIIISSILKALWIVPLSVQANKHIPLFLSEMHMAFIFSGYIFSQFSQYAFN